MGKDNEVYGYTVPAWRCDDCTQIHLTAPIAPRRCYPVDKYPCIYWNADGAPIDTVIDYQARPDGMA